ncbi:hypothetical protein [Larkinella sp. C7]|uniref:hypothetical protein n=1 Tax=Larkinella sp. C7 TaxID=2576607 RepID=UPI0011110276|nr:hypothetical protein [Larkinella sp. C7]
MSEVINYIRLMNWFWEVVPYLPGYKSEYGSVFLAVVDSCNRNGWRETAVEFDRLINKVRCSKRMYYEALRWLTGQDLITYKPGRNEYAPASFNLSEWLKAEVQKCTATVTSPAPQSENSGAFLHLNNTATDTSTAPINNKLINNKPKNKNTSVNKDKIAFRENVYLQQSEYDKLEKEFGKDFADRCLDKLSNYKLSHGKSYKSDYGAIHNWVIDEVEKKQSRSSGSHLNGLTVAPTPTAKPTLR